MGPSLQGKSGDHFPMNKCSANLVAENGPQLNNRTQGGSSQGIAQMTLTAVWAKQAVSSPVSKSQSSQANSRLGPSSSSERQAVNSEVIVVDDDVDEVLIEVPAVGRVDRARSFTASPAVSKASSTAMSVASISSALQSTSGSSPVSRHIARQRTPSPTPSVKRRRIVKTQPLDPLSSPLSPLPMSLTHPQPNTAESANRSVSSTRTNSDRNTSLSALPLGSSSRRRFHTGLTDLTGSDSNLHRSFKSPPSPQSADGSPERWQEASDSIDFENSPVAVFDGDASRVHEDGVPLHDPIDDVIDLESPRLRRSDNPKKSSKGSAKDVKVVASKVSIDVDQMDDLGRPPVSPHATMNSSTAKIPTQDFNIDGIAEPWYDDEFDDENSGAGEVDRSVSSNVTRTRRHYTPRHVNPSSRPDRTPPQISSSARHNPATTRPIPSRRGSLGPNPSPSRAGPRPQPSFTIIIPTGPRTPPLPSSRKPGGPRPMPSANAVGVSIVRETAVASVTTAIVHKPTTEPPRPPPRPTSSPLASHPSKRVDNSDSDSDSSLPSPSRLLHPRKAASVAPSAPPTEENLSRRSSSRINSHSTPAAIARSSSGALGVNTFGAGVDPSVVRLRKLMEDRRKREEEEKWRGQVRAEAPLPSSDDDEPADSKTADASIDAAQLEVRFGRRKGRELGALLCETGSMRETKVMEPLRCQVPRTLTRIACDLGEQGRLVRGTVRDLLSRLMRGKGQVTAECVADVVITCSDPIAVLAGKRCLTRIARNSPGIFVGTLLIDRAIASWSVPNTWLEPPDSGDDTVESMVDRIRIEKEHVDKVWDSDDRLLPRDLALANVPGVIETVVECMVGATVNKRTLYSTSDLLRAATLALVACCDDRLALHGATMARCFARIVEELSQVQWESARFQILRRMDNLMGSDRSLQIVMMRRLGSARGKAEWIVVQAARRWALGYTGSEGVSDKVLTLGDMSTDSSEDVKSTVIDRDPVFLIHNATNYTLLRGAAEILLRALGGPAGLNDERDAARSLSKRLRHLYGRIRDSATNLEPVEAKHLILCVAHYIDSLVPSGSILGDDGSHQRSITNFFKATSSTNIVK
ncbi:hypothetical protein M427DRAFT_51493 [Gonapodya prolifera JEL478]|uniref:Uncharacterized protein n=1 Tax=Gonapodya prolifera (strain JEL478) TaxID=1344416 RepID=A0A139AWX0_GONPJ|nr:hypothetical protein M427DRAFT_51493 [Gonapodya prolifera JEL478]|eukprot:KXS21242.1 hypothetical protein M427DRAFT_51493 [Gonapodya prolifera JEL478]